VDPRIMAMVAIVFDELNFIENILHHYQSYGGWSFAFKDFWNLNLTKAFGNPKMDEIQAVADVYGYREKLIMPKFVASGVMDEFFMLDNTRYWWHDMPYATEMNRFLIAPNADHVQVGGFLELLPAAATWTREILAANEARAGKYGGKTPMAKSIEERNSASLELAVVADIPQFNWTIAESGDITVHAATKPISVHMWHATTCNSERRDFRVVNLDDPCTCGLTVPMDGQSYCANLQVFWTSVQLHETSPGSLTWVAHREPPSGGRWTAFFVDLQFEGMPAPGERGWPTGEDGIYEFSTSVSIVPTTFPFEKCSGEDCYGKLV